MNILHIAWKFICERQPPLVRILHITILCLVLSQIVVSNFMGFADNGEVSRKTIEHYGTWLHISTGLLLLPVALVFFFVELKQHGLKYFFPYFYGNFSQLNEDVKKLKQFKLPEPSASGIAAIVQGLGLGALILVIWSGLAWFVSWAYIATWSDSLKEIHEILTGLIEVYVVGHGGMGFLHLFFQLKNK